MASTKLSAEDKKAIVKLYQEVGQTAATVAEQYGVSVSTISRLLKSELPADTYEALVRQKRGGGETKSKKRTSRKKPVSKLKKEAAKPEVVETAVVDEPAEVEVEIKASEEPTSEEEKAPTRTRRRRTRSSSEKKKRPVSRRKSKEPEEDVVAKEEVTAEEPAPEVLEVEATVEVEDNSRSRKKPVRRTRPRLKKTAEIEEASAEESNVETVETAEVADEEQESKPRRRTRRRTRARAVVEEVPEVVDVVTEEADPSVEVDEAGDLALDDLTDTLSSGSGDEDFDDAFDDDDDLEDDDDGSDNITSLRRRSSGADVVQIQPLSEANLSRMLYLVIDRTADLITMPMVFFSDLGELPEEEERKKTLPVFENHRVARRFSQRNQRVIKVPDGELISKTASWLEAKGITRCLLDGQVYSLESADR